MKYTIVWNENKTEGIILSGEEQFQDSITATTGCGLGKRSCLASEFYQIYGMHNKCQIQEGLVSMQPTTEMIEAGIEQYNDSYDSGDEIEDMMVFIWQAMLGMMK